MRSGRMRKGFLGFGVVGIILALAIVGVLAFTLFGGGAPSTGLFGWGNIPALAGIEVFITSIYNAFVFISTWISIGVLGLIFIGLQILFIFIYYKIFVFIYAHKDMLNKLLDDITDF